MGKLEELIETVQQHKRRLVDAKPDESVAVRATPEYRESKRQFEEAHEQYYRILEEFLLTAVKEMRICGRISKGPKSYSVDHLSDVFGGRRYETVTERYVWMRGTTEGGYEISMDVKSSVSVPEYGYGEERPFWVMRMTVCKDGEVVEQLEFFPSKEVYCLEQKVFDAMEERIRLQAETELKSTT